MQEQEDNKKRELLYEKTREELLDRQLSNSQLYDRAILTLSTSALGLSIAFIKDIFPDLETRCFLIASWCLFSFAIISTILSFWAGQKAIKIHLIYAEKFYLEKNEDYRKTSCYAKISSCLNYCSGGLFIAAVVSTLVFVLINI